MATFYPNTSAQVDVLSTPYGQDQKFTSYSESPIIHGNMMMYLNGASSDGSFSEVAQGASMAGRNEMMFIPPTRDHIPMQNIGGQSNATAMHALTEEMLLTSRSQLSIVDGERNFHGLSLSLSTQLSTAVPPASYEQFSKVDEAFHSKDWPYDLHGDGQNSMRFGVPNNLQGVGYNVNQYEQAGATRTIMKSRFLRAAQQLLDEVVSVQDALKQHVSGKDQNVKKVEDGPSESKEKSSAASDVNESATALGQELSATERQDLQNKLDKLVAMLEEVDRRYKQYYHQMQILVSSFELVAGSGAAKLYTTLASKTISRHFRSLRDAISAQIQATRKSLGEQDSGQAVIPRLRYVDQQLRQQRALQQFGMMRHAWRPQRGLPENAVTALRAWLFEHFLNPYPKDSEKIMLARQTGLTRGQVTNWFINARVRLWKPMVEEMYKEEFGEADLNLKPLPENAAKAAVGETSKASEDRREELQESFRSMGDSGHPGPSHNESKANFNHHTAEMNQSIGRSGMMVSPHGGDDKHKGLMKLYENHQSINNHGFYTNDQNGLMSFQVPELGSYEVNNQVSLALGLRRIDGDVGHTTMRPGTSAENEVGPEAGEYSYFGQVSQQHKFGNTHLLDDFVV